MKKSTVSKRVASRRVTRKSSSHLNAGTGAGGAVDVGRAILNLSGGYDFGSGKPDAMQGQWRTCSSSGMAGRAARFMFFKRGIVPTDESVLDAAGASALAMAQAIDSGAVSGLSGDAGAVSGAVWDGVYDQLCLVARNAAFVSLTHDACQGRTGMQAGSDRVSSYTLALDASALAVEKVGLDVWLQTCQINETADRPYVAGTTAAADAAAADAAAVASIPRRVAALARIKSVIWSDAIGRKGFADRMRYKFIAALASGMAIADAAKRAKFANARSAVESLRNGKVWERLGIPRPRRTRAGFMR